MDGTEGGREPPNADLGGARRATEFFALKTVARRRRRRRRRQRGGWDERAARTHMRRSDVKDMMELLLKMDTIPQFTN